MKAIIPLLIFAGTLALPLFAEEKCPICGGTVITVGKIPDEESKPSKNGWVWDTSSCSNGLFDEDSLICTNCWLAKDANEPVTWMRISELPDSFFIPLGEAIRGFPAPKNSASYEQRFEDKQRCESLFLWCEDSPELIARFRKYCVEHELTLNVQRSEKYPKQVFVEVEGKPIAQQGGAGQPATRSESDSEGGDKPQPESEERSR